MSSSSSQQTSGIPQEYWMFMGIAVAISGHFQTFAAIIAVYFILKHFRCDIQRDLLVIGSIFWGLAFVEAFKLLLLGKSLSFLWEQIVVAAAAAILLCARRRAWARLLFAYCIFAGLVFVATIREQPSLGAERFAIARATLYFLAAWLLARWLRQQRIPHAKGATP